MKRSYALEFVLSTPWAILPAKFAEVLAVAERHAAGIELSADELAEIKAAARPSGGARQAGAVAVIPVLGTIIPRGDSLAESSGAISATRIAAMFQAAQADPGVGAIVLDISSPGGAAAGVEELSQLIYQARGGKPVVAVANYMAASAAYWIGCACETFVVSPSAQVGSIGVFAAHQDESAAMEAAGVKVTLISAGKYKTEGNPFQPLSEEALAYAQSMVDETYSTFVKAVARGRGVGVADVRDGFGQGRMVGAREAVALGMADRVATMDEVMADMMKPKKMPMNSRAERMAALLTDELKADIVLTDEAFAAMAKKENAAFVETRRRRLRLAEKESPAPSSRS